MFETKLEKKNKKDLERDFKGTGMDLDIDDVKVGPEEVRKTLEDFSDRYYMTPKRKSLYEKHLFCEEMSRKEGISRKNKKIRDNLLNEKIAKEVASVTKKARKEKKAEMFWANLEKI